jgi:hypothetical protein
LSLLFQAVIIIACLYYYSATLLVVAQEAQVENPCLACPYGVSEGLDDYAPFASLNKDPITCKEIIDNAKQFETGSLWCAHYEYDGKFCCTTPPDDPCILCPNGITVADNYEPYNDGYTCAVWVDYYAAYFDAESDTCTVGRGTIFESHCCPSVANNPCTICPDGATVGKEFVPYNDDGRTCEDIINAALTFDAESEMCLVWAKEDEYKCCPSNTTSFDDYCNICPDGILAGNNFVQQWSGGNTCKDLVEDAKLYENGSVGCNFYKGYELRCCGGAVTGSENKPPSFVPTPSPTPVDPIKILEVTSAVVGIVAALVGAAVGFARWKRKNSSPTPAVPTSVATSTNMKSSTSTLTDSATVPQSTNVCNTPMPSQPTPTYGPRSSSLDTSRSFKDLIGEI